MHVGFADEDRAGAFQLRDHDGVFGGDAIGQRFERGGRPDARGVVEILNADRDVAQGTGLGVARGGVSLIREDSDEGVQRGV